MKGLDVNEGLLEQRENIPGGQRSAGRLLAGLIRWGRLLRLLTIALLILFIIALTAALSSANGRQREMQERLDLQNDILVSMERELEDANAFIRAAEPVITNETISESINSLRELVTKEYLYTNAGRYENHNEVSISSFTVGVPLTKKSFTVVYDGRIKAGVDLSKAQIDVNDTLHSVIVTLPASEVTSHEIFENTVQRVDEKDALFNRNTIDDYSDFLTQQKANMEEKVRTNGFLTSADREAREIVRSVLSLLPGMDTYQLTVK